MDESQGTYQREREIEREIVTGGDGRLEDDVNASGMEEGRGRIFLVKQVG